MSGQFARGNVGEFEGRVRVEEGDEVGSSVSTSTDEGYSFGSGRVGSGGREGSGRRGRSGGRGRRRANGRSTSRGREGSKGGSDVARRLNGTAGGRSVGDGEVRSFDSVVLLKLLDESFDFTGILNSVVEEGTSVASEGAVSTFKVPRFVLVVGLGSPEESFEVLLDRVEDVVGDSVLDCGSVGEELGHDGYLTFRVRYDGDDITRFVSIDGVRSLRFLEFAENLSDTLASRSDILVPFGEYSSESVLSYSLDRLVLVKLVSSTKESSGTRVGEEFFLEVVG